MQLERKGTHWYWGQGAGLASRLESHLCSLIGWASCQSHWALGRRIGEWLITLSGEWRVPSSRTLHICKYKWSLCYNGDQMKWIKRLDKRTWLGMFSFWRLVSIMSQWGQKISNVGKRYSLVFLKMKLSCFNKSEKEKKAFHYQNGGVEAQNLILQLVLIQNRTKSSLNGYLSYKV